MVGGVAAAAAVRTFPFRVFSFPANLVMPLPEFAEKYLKPIRFIDSYPAQPQMLTRFDTIFAFRELDKLHEMMNERNRTPLILRIASC